MDSKQVLADLRRVPVSRWNYKGEDPSVQHVCPMVEDFCSAFVLGMGAEHIAALDLGGINTVAIQALSAGTGEQVERIKALKAQNAELTRAVEELRTFVAALGV